MVANFSDKKEKCSSVVSKACCARMEKQNQKSNSESKNKSENDCPIRCCANTTCSISIGTISESEKINLPIILEVKSKFIIKNATLSSSYTCNCWQPPELI